MNMLIPVAHCPEKIGGEEDVSPRVLIGPHTKQESYQSDQPPSADNPGGLRLEHAAPRLLPRTFDTLILDTEFESNFQYRLRPDYGD